MISLVNVFKKGVIQPKYIFAVAIVLIIVMVGMGLYEFSASKRDIMHVLEEEAMSLAETISVMGDNSLLSFSKTMELMSKKALDNCKIIEVIDYEGFLSKEVLDSISRQNDIYQIRIFDKNGKEILVYQSNEQAFADEFLQIEEEIKKANLMLENEKKEFVTRLSLNEGDKFIVGVSRRKGGSIVLITGAEELLDYRKSMGIGRLVQEIGENEGVEYIVLQDRLGLILASRNVTKMRKIEGDSFLENALQNRIIDSRIYSYNNKDVLEAVVPFLIDEKDYGLFRIGLSMELAKAVESRGKNRLILISIVSLAVGVILLSLLIVNQNYSLLSKAHDRIQTYTEIVLENIADGIIVADSKKIISVFNKASELIFKRSAKELLNKNISVLDPQMDEIFSSALLMDNYSCEITSDNNRILSIHTSRLTSEDENLAIAVVRDITETKIMEENIRRTEQLTAMGKLASAVAHEIRNPLNAISMVVQRLAREFVPNNDKEKYEEMIGMMKSESNRLNKIIEEFLKFARPPKLNRQPTNMDQLLDETLSLISLQLKNTNIEIIKNYSKLGDWNIDKEQIKQAILNLLLNAIEAMPEGGKLSINAQNVDNTLLIEISDTGKGIPEEDIPRIFDLYFTTKDTGTGLGLSIVQRIVIEHGGLITVNSTLGKGTSFKIYIPEK